MSTHDPDLGRRTNRGGPLHWLRLGGRLSGRVSFSAGLPDVHAYRDTRAALRAADEALFRATDAGRNRVSIASPDDHLDGAES